MRDLSFINQDKFGGYIVQIFCRETRAKQWNFYGLIIIMLQATGIGINPLWYNIASGFSASYCYCLPVGTPGNLVVQSATNMPTGKMVILLYVFYSIPTLRPVRAQKFSTLIPVKNILRFMLYII